MNPLTNTKTRILLLEDEIFVGELYSRALEKAGYQITLAGDGRKGLDLALTDSYDLILLDLMMPKIPGIQILKTLRDNPKTKPVHAKIIVVTNLEYQGPNRQDIERLADGYLLKADTTPRQLVEYLSSVDIN